MIHIIFGALSEHVIENLALQIFGNLHFLAEGECAKYWLYYGEISEEWVKERERERERKRKREDQERKRRGGRKWESEIV